MSKSKDKGSYYERELATKLTEAGIPTRRVAGSGALGRVDSRLEGDLQIGTHGLHGNEWLLTGEVKYRRGGEGFRVLEAMLGENDLLLLRRAYAEPWGVVPWPTLILLLQAYYHYTLEAQ